MIGYSIGIITASDQVWCGEREDASGRTIAAVMKYAAHIKHTMIVPDERPLISAAITEMADEFLVDIIFTTGGTGFRPRDVTPEATLAVIDRQVPGIAEAMRYRLAAKAPQAMLMRAVTGIRGSSLVINLPGSPKGIKECLDEILPVLEQAVAMMKGKTVSCT
ncbi:MAG: MogA/MoaB family molybdenum cofactor biosynthesis protein [Pelosinus sp.]|nr:MogA/MoaB family molybdenum cofactor biosynthesis protein [Pelosinus sp.]